MRTHFEHFVGLFPEIELPVTLGEDRVHDFSAHNAALPQRLIETYLVPAEADVDDLTEFVPCFRIAGTKDFYAIVYWRAGLMSYQYVLATFTKEGALIDRAVVAGTYSDGRRITRSYGRLDSDWTITIISGQTTGSSEDYDASSSRAVELDLQPNGTISALE